MRDSGATSVGVHPIGTYTSFVLAKVCKARRAYVGALLAEHGLHVGQERADVSPVGLADLR